LLAKGYWGACNGLTNIELPLKVNVVPHVDSDSREFKVFVTGHAEGQPPSNNDQSPVSVDVKTLVSVPTTAPGSDSELLLRKSRMVRKNIGLNLNAPTGPRKCLRGEYLGGVVATQKRVPWDQGLISELDKDRTLSREKLSKHHREVHFDSLGGF
jgi:hypothetical protein